MQRPVSPDRLVLAGFGALLILMGALAADSARQARDVSATSSQLRKGSRDRDTLLDQLLTDTYRSATLVRDYVLEQDDLHASRQKNEPATLRSRIDDALTRYAAMAPAPESRRHAEPEAARGIVLEFVGAGIGLESAPRGGQGANDFSRPSSFPGATNWSNWRSRSSRSMNGHWMRRKRGFNLFRRDSSAR